MRSQNEQILAHLKAGNMLSPLTALNEFGCFRLAARVHDLKADGHTIYKNTTKHSSSGKRITRYWMVPEPEQLTMRMN